jgi:hypothetical protein
VLTIIALATQGTVGQYYVLLFDNKRFNTVSHELTPIRLDVIITEARAVTGRVKLTLGHIGMSVGRQLGRVACKSRSFGLITALLA